MRLRRILALVTLLGFVLGPPLEAFAKQNAACEAAEKYALKKALKKIGGQIAEDIAGEGAKATGSAIAGGTIVGMDAVVEYFTHPDDTRLEAALHKLLEGGTKIVFPAYGLTAIGGRFLLGTQEKPGLASQSVQAVIHAAESGQLDAFICGDASFNNLFTKTSFFDLAAVGGKGITCQNFTSRIASDADLESMKTLWFGYYKRLLLERNPGAENAAQAQRLLEDGWERLEEQWKLIWSEKLTAQMRDALKEEASQFKTDRANAVCYADPTPAPTPTPVPTQPPLTRSAHGCFGFNGIWRGQNVNILISGGTVVYPARTQKGLVNANVMSGSWSGASDGSFVYTLRPGGDAFDANEHDLTAAKRSTYVAQCIQGTPTPTPARSPTPTTTNTGCPYGYIRATTGECVRYIP